MEGEAKCTATKAFKAAAVNTKLPLQDSQLSYTTRGGFMFSRAGSRLEILNEIIYFEVFVSPGEMRVMCGSVFWGGSQGLGGFCTSANCLNLLCCFAAGGGLEADYTN